jgi:hypothetical protein
MRAASTDNPEFFRRFRMVILHLSQTAWIEHLPRQVLSPTAPDTPLKGKDLVPFETGLKRAPACTPLHPCRPRLTVEPPSVMAGLPPARLRAIIMTMKPSFLALFLALCAACASAEQSAPPSQPKSQESDTLCPMHDDHSKMNERGEKGMGFSQSATIHHFLLNRDGGVIQVEANDPKDAAVLDSIRTHLKHISHAFAGGDFDMPTFVHDTVPVGVPDMKRLKDKITYTFQQTPAGGRVVISTSDPEAVAAIHKFLRFQIDEHQTHDATEIH